jgi:hypothetical protein
MFHCMKISYIFFRHLGPQILSLMNKKNQPNGEKMNHFVSSPFRMDFVIFKILISYIIQSNALYEHCQTYMYALFIHERKLKLIALFNTFLFIPLRQKLQLKHGFKLFKRIQKDINTTFNLFLEFFSKLT